MLNYTFLLTFVIAILWYSFSYLPMCVISPIYCLKNDTPLVCNNFAIHRPPILIIYGRTVLIE